MEINNVANPTLESIVSEQDFPQQNLRLQNIINRYRKENQVPEFKTKSTTDTTMVQPKVFTQLKTKKFEELSDFAKQKVVNRISNIDYRRSSDILGYGSLKDSSLTQNANEIIRKYSANDFGKISEAMAELVAIIRRNSPVEMIGTTYPVESKKEWGIFSSLMRMFSLKKERKKLEKVLAQQESILKNISAIEVFLEKQKVDLENDVKVYEQMDRDTYSQLAELEYDQIGLRLMLEDAEMKLETIMNKEEIDMFEYSEQQTLKNAVERMERRMYTLQTLKIVTLQSIPELAILVRGDEIIIEKIDEIQCLIIPMWKWQYAIALGAVIQREALSIQKIIRGITSKLITRNAKLLHDNMISAQEELYAAAVAVEDLVIVQQYIDDMVLKVGEVRKVVAVKTVEGMKKMAEIENKNEACLTNSVQV